MDSNLQATKLCDFDVAPEIKNTALTLTNGLTDTTQKVNALACFVREFKYTYDEWYVPASETLARKTGMCSSKTNLMVAMLRSIGILSRYRLLRISAESELLQWLIKQDPRISWANYVNQQNHVMTDVLLDNVLSLDLSKDTAYEKWLRKIGLPVEIKLDDEHPQLIATFDEWSYQRYLQRINSRHQPVDLALENAQLEIIRQIGAQ